MRRALAILCCSLLLPIVPFVLIGELPGERWLLASGDDGRVFGGTGALLLALDVLLPIPSSVLGSLLAGRLGFAWGFVWTWLGLSAGQLLGYALGRLLPERFRSELPHAPSLVLVFLSRPVPVLAEAVALAAGTTRMPFPAFAASLALGNGCYALALAGNGAALLPQGLTGPGVLLPMALPVASYALFRALKRAR